MGGDERLEGMRLHYLLFMLHDVWRWGSVVSPSHIIIVWHCWLLRTDERDELVEHA